MYALATSKQRIQCHFVVGGGACVIAYGNGTLHFSAEHLLK